MQLTRHQTRQGARWAIEGTFLPPSLTLSALLELRRDAARPELFFKASGWRVVGTEMPLYLPQAKIYNGSCALGHGILLSQPDDVVFIQVGPLTIKNRVSSLR